MIDIINQVVKNLLFRTFYFLRDIYERYLLLKDAN